MKKQFTFDLQRFADINDLTNDGITYKIGSVADLKTLAAYVNAGNDTTGLTFKQTADIIFDEAAEGESNFTAIGNNSNRFNGTFDGDGYTIKNLTIDDAQSSELGLFGIVGSNGTILNVNLVDANVSGSQAVGALVGYNAGGTIEKSTTMGGTIEGRYYIGGLVGYNAGTISDIWVYEVTGKCMWGLFGSFVGGNGGTVSGYYYNTTVGFTGAGLHTDVYLLTLPDNVTAEFKDGDTVTFRDNTYCRKNATITKLTIIDQDEAKYLKGVLFNNDGTYTVTSSIEWADIPTIDGLTFDQSINAYKISSVADLEALAAYVNEGGDTTDLIFKQTQDIGFEDAAEGESNFTAIGDYYNDYYFNGTFDGGGHTIKNLTIDDAQSSGLGMFGVVGTTGMILNANLVDANVSGGSYVGALVGWNEGTVENCTTTDVTVNGNYVVGGLVGYNGGTVNGNTAAGTVSGEENVGGLVGGNYGTVSGNTAAGTVKCTGTGTYLYHIGGLVGYNYYGTVENCTTSSTVDGKCNVGGLVGSNNGGTVENCTATGDSVTGVQVVGGLVGQNGGTVENCTATVKTVTATSQTAGGLVGQNGGIIEDCSVEGSSVNIDDDNVYQYVGGLVGSNGGIIENSTVTDAEVKGNYHYIGGIAGVNHSGTIENSMATNTSVSGQWFVGGIAGNNYYGRVRSSLVDGGSVTGNNYVGGIVGRIESDGTVDGCLIENNVTVSGTGENVGSFVGNNVGTLQNFYYHNFTAEITGTGSDTAEEVFRITLPDGVMAQGDGVVSLVGRYYTPKDTEITLAGQPIQSNATYVVVDDDKVYTVTKDTTIDVDVYISVNGGTFENTTENISVIGGDGNEILINTAADVTLDGGAGNDSLVGSDNTEVFVYGGGSDTINSFTANDDTIRLADGFKVSGNLQVDGDNLEINFANSGKLIIEGAASLNSIKLYNEDGSNYQTILVEKIELNNDNESSAKSATVTGAYADFSKQNPNRTEVYTKLTNITATQPDSQIIGNSNNNLIVVSGGSDNILTGGLGKDTYSFSEGGGIITDFGIGATKSGDGTALATSPKKADYDSTDPTTYAPGIDALKIKGTVNGIYFDSGDETAGDSTFDAVISYNDGDDDQIIVLNNIIKKPTKTGATPIYQTNDVAAETLKIWDTSGNRQAVLSAAKLKKLFHDDDDLSDTQQEQVNHLSALVEPKADITATSENLLRGNAFTPQLTFSGNTSKN